MGSHSKTWWQKLRHVTMFFQWGKLCPSMGFLVSPLLSDTPPHQRINSVWRVQLHSNTSGHIWTVGGAQSTFLFSNWRLWTQCLSLFWLVDPRSWPKAYMFSCLFWVMEWPIPKLPEIVKPLRFSISFSAWRSKNPRRFRASLRWHGWNW